jgi:hypothetical protein
MSSPSLVQNPFGSIPNYHPNVEGWESCSERHAEAVTDEELAEEV